MILSFCGYHAESELLASERRFWAFIRRAVWLEANLNVKREMSESFGKPLTAFETFKARFEELLKELFPTETRKVDGSDLSVPNFLVLRYRRRLGRLPWMPAIFWSRREDGEVKRKNHADNTGEQLYLGAAFYKLLLPEQLREALERVQSL